MRLVRFLTILLTVLALNNQALAAFTRMANVERATSTRMYSGHTDAQANADIAAQMDADMAATHVAHRMAHQMDCCDPDAPKPCDSSTNGSCTCRLGQGCQPPQIYQVTTYLTMALATIQLMPMTTASTQFVARSPSRLLRPPIY